MRTSLFIMSIALMVSGCAGMWRDGSGFEDARTLWSEVNGRDTYSSYGKAFASEVNERRLYAGSRCNTQFAQRNVQLVMMVDANGVISDVHAKWDTPRARCFRDQFVGIKMPAPPFSPFPMPVTMR